MIFSTSRLETYLQCPQKFKFGYIDQIKSELEGIEAFMGSRVHEALHRLYFELRHTKRNTLEDLLAFYRERWEAAWHPNIVIVREGLTPEHYLDLGATCLSDYYRRYAPFDQSRTLGLEHYVAFSLDPDGKYLFQGYVDRISQPKDGVIWIHDYKAKAYLPTQKEADADRQLAFYQMAVLEMWPDVREVELVWHYLIYDKEIRSRRSREDLERLRQESIALIDTILSGTDFPPRQSGLCDWCEFRPRCPLFRHEYELAALPANRYLDNDGFQLVERLAALQHEEGRIREEIDQIKAALIAKAEAMGYEAFFGKDHKVRVKFYDSWKFPGKNDPGRPDLEREVKASGRWMEFSQLDVFALSKAMVAGAVPPDLAERLRPLGRQEKHPWVKLFKRNQK